MSTSPVLKAPFWAAGVLGVSAIALRVVVEVNHVKNAEPGLAAEYLISGLVVLAVFAIAAAAYISLGFRGARRWQAWAEGRDGAFVARFDKPTLRALDTFGIQKTEGYFGVVLGRSEVAIWRDSKQPRAAVTLEMLEPMVAGEFTVAWQPVPTLNITAKSEAGQVVVPLALVEPRFGMFYSLRPQRMADLAGHGAIVETGETGA